MKITVPVPPNVVAETKVDGAVVVVIVNGEDQFLTPKQARKFARAICRNAVAADAERRRRRESEVPF